jgi:hypothetical protein
VYRVRNIVYKWVCCVSGIQFLGRAVLRNVLESRRSTVFFLVDSSRMLGLICSLFAVPHPAPTEVRQSPARPCLVSCPETEARPFLLAATSPL